MSQATYSLRQSLQLQRRSISQKEREHFDYCIHQNLIKSGVLLRSNRIAGYFSNNGEPAVDLLMQICGERNLAFYLPVINKRILRFCLYKWGDDLQNNVFNIPQPANQHSLPSQFLSTILMPLVGFDSQGNRLGMGGGYYDRSLSFTLASSCKKKPLLIGIAYSCQQVKNIIRQNWDVSLDAVITEKGLTCFSSTAEQLLHSHR